MRDYGVVSPKFWIGETGKALRGNAPAQVLALYLMTCPHANMIGVFHCPVLYMAHETGLGMEGASEALRSLIEADYCTYDEPSETIFVHRMAAYQVAESLKPGDNRVKGVEREWQNIGSALLKQAFFAMYSVAFHLPEEAKSTSRSQAPSKPLASQEQEQEQDKEPNGSVGSADRLPRCDTQSVVDLYHEVLPELPAVRLMNDARRKAVSSLWKFVLTSRRGDGERRATTAPEAMDWIRGYFTRARDNDFLMGRGYKAPGHEGWQCDFDFLLSEKGKKHVIEKTQVTA